MRLVIDNCPPLTERRRQAVERALLEERKDPVAERVEMARQAIFGSEDAGVKARAAAVALPLYGPSRS